MGTVRKPEPLRWLRGGWGRAPCPEKWAAQQATSELALPQQSVSEFWMTDTQQVLGKCPVGRCGRHSSTKRGE